MLVAGMKSALGFRRCAVRPRAGSLSRVLSAAAGGAASAGLVGVPELLRAPSVIRLGSRVSPQLEHVCHRKMPRAATYDVEVEEADDGALYVSGNPFLSGRHSSTLSGVSTSHGRIPPFLLSASVMLPNKALWKLSACSPIPERLAVREDPRDASHILWAPRSRMHLEEYTAALHSVGRSMDGTLLGWNMAADPFALLDSLPLTAEEKQRARAGVEEQIRLARKLPTSKAEFVAHAVLGLCLTYVEEGVADVGFLSSMAELATSIVDERTWDSFAAACQLVACKGSHAAHASAITADSGKRSLSTASNVSQRAAYAVLLYYARDDPMQDREMQFIRTAMLTARRQLMLRMPALLDLEDAEAEAAWEEEEDQFKLARAAVADLGFVGMDF